MIWGITGASGQLAKSLIDLLELKGTSFIGWSRDELDISNKNAIEIVVKAKPKVLINCAAYTAVDKAESESDLAEAINHFGAANMATAAKELGIPFVHISTDYVFSGSSKSPWSVEDETGPLSVYGLTKLKGERAVMSIYANNSYVLRTAWLYSQYGDNFAKKVLKKGLTSNSEIRMVHDQLGQPTSTVDLAEQICLLMQKRPTPGIFHATNSGQGSWFDFTKEIFKLAELSETLVIPISSREFPTAAKRPEYSVLDDSKWASVEMPKMPDWRSALKRAFPDLYKRAKEELANG